MGEAGEFVKQTGAFPGQSGALPGYAQILARPAAHQHVTLRQRFVRGGANIVHGRGLGEPLSEQPAARLVPLDVRGDFKTGAFKREVKAADAREQGDDTASAHAIPLSSHVSSRAMTCRLSRAATTQSHVWRSRALKMRKRRVMAMA